MKNILIAISGVLVLMNGMVYGQSETPVIDHQPMEQESWIERSFDRGQLDHREATRPDREPDRIGRMEQRANTEGVEKKKEGVRIGAAKKRTSRPIVRQQPDRRATRNR